MAAQAESLMKLRELARESTDNGNEFEEDEDEISHYATRITKSLQSLQAQVKQNEEALEKVIEIKSRQASCEGSG